MVYSPKTTWILIVMALAIALGGPALMRFSHLDMWTRTILVIILLLAGCGLGWRALFYRDEVQRQTALRAWFWGSQCGLLVTAVLVLLLRASGGVNRLAAMMVGQQPHNANGYFALGLFLPVMAQLIGCVIAAAILELQTRSRT